MNEIEGREEFVRTNAMSLLQDRDEKIKRQKKTLTALNHRVIAQLHQLGTANKEVEGLKRQVEHLHDGRTTTCVFCGHAYPPGTPPHGSEALKEHISQCPQHPMRALEKRFEHAMRGLESVTPGGSEYVGDINSCLAHIRQRLDEKHALVVKFKLERDEARAAGVVMLKAIEQIQRIEVVLHENAADPIAQACERVKASVSKYFWLTERQRLYALLREIADENRPTEWCEECSAWITSKSASGSDYCPQCGCELRADSAQTRYEQMAKEMLTLAKE
ncbi:MAG: hypothetical protein L0312_20150 [Acidobacteria bacterium]|nr:hypothetical protein [Acidobacteriota bacterium]